MQPTADQWQGQMRANRVSSVEVTNFYLDRIEAADALVNAVTVCDRERALEQAKRADRIRADGATEVSPLLGVPVTVKDSIGVEGWPFRAATGGDAGVANSDSVVVSRLRAAGGVIIAKTNMPVLGSSYETENRVFGRTSHPLDPTRTPGGSSGGEAALLGADASVVGVGTDGGGSIRVPSHYCGLIGLRPTAGRIPETGTWPYSRAGGTLDISTLGPMGRSTADVGNLLDVIAGPDHGDPASMPVSLRTWTDVDLGGLRVGWYTADGTAAADEPTQHAVEEASTILAGYGAQVEWATPPQVTEATSIFFRLLAADGGAGVRAAVGDDPARHTDQFLRLLNSPPHGGSSSASAYFALLGELQALRARVRRWLDRYDVILAPVSPSTAPRHHEPPAGVSAANYDRYLGFNFTHTYSIAGVPAGSVPVAVHEGLPIGVQVIGRAWREDLVLAAMAGLEAETGGFALVDRPAL